MQTLNERNRRAWEANAAAWDAKMGDTGNDFVNLLQWPVLRPLLHLQPGQRVLDLACGNGLFSRRMAALGAQVTACDFSAPLLERARQRTHAEMSIQYLHIDLTDPRALEETLLPTAPYHAALCNMALFDIADIEPLFRTLPDLLAPQGVFVFSLLHPAFNNPSCVKVAEEWDDGEIHTRYGVTTWKYMSIYHTEGLALRNQPEPQVYFHRPLQYYLQMGFAHGFVLDAFEERAFPPDAAQSTPLGWGSAFHEIPPVIVLRMRRCR
ncbi:MAG: class I SAM-dependent methyltransferase [Anaerolineae bacterium]|nr:MAG: class I SAM-dependent methyltransferase [Anaerolineae bacterium]